MVQGTSYFRDLRSAILYYAEYGIDRAGTERKIAEGQIHIGKPAVAGNQQLKLIDNGRRYAIVTKDDYIKCTQRTFPGCGCKGYHSTKDQST